jgi:hypothetical protein
MALKPCRRCGRLVNTRADRCQDCHVERPTTRLAPAIKRAIMWAVMVILVGAILATSLSSPNGSRSRFPFQTVKYPRAQDGLRRVELDSLVRARDSLAKSWQQTPPPLLRVGTARNPSGLKPTPPENR